MLPPTCMLPTHTHVQQMKKLGDKKPVPTKSEELVQYLVERLS